MIYLFHNMQMSGDIRGNGVSFYVLDVFSFSNIYYVFPLIGSFAKIHSSCNYDTKGADLHSDQQASKQANLGNYSQYQE